MIGSKKLVLLIGALLLIGVVNGQNLLRDEACQALCGSRYNPFNSEWDISGRGRNWGRWKVNSGSGTKYAGTNPWFWEPPRAKEAECYGPFCPENHKPGPPMRDQYGNWLNKATTFGNRYPPNHGK